MSFPTARSHGRARSFDEQIDHAGARAAVREAQTRRRERSRREFRADVKAAARRAKRGGAGALGKDGSSVTPGTAALVAPARDRRFAWRSVSRQFIRDDLAETMGGEVSSEMLGEIARCGWAASSSVEVRATPGADAPARFRGLRTCKSVWACPCCSAVIRSRRAVEVQEMASWWTEREAGHLAMVTFTLRHSSSDALEDNLSTLVEAMTRVIRGAPWKRFAERHGIEHHLKAVEVTLSRRSGWHPHLHVLWFLRESMSEDTRRAAEGWLFDRWQKMLGKLGADAARTWGVKLTTGHGAEVVGRYLTKLQESKSGRGWGIASEMTRGDLKQGRSDESINPLQLLDIEGLEDEQVDWHRERWIEWIEATRGRRALSPSRGLKAAAGIDDLSDEELVAADEAEEPAEETTVAVIGFHDWRSIQDDSDALGMVLHLAETGRADEIVLAIRAHVRMRSGPKSVV